MTKGCLDIMQKTKTVKITLRLPGALANEMKRLAAATDRSLNGAIVSACRAATAKGAK